ncbi:MAG: hypothetical protein ACJAQ1_000617, partial [Flavobacterium sp.]
MKSLELDFFNQPDKAAPHPCQVQYRQKIHPC